MRNPKDFVFDPPASLKRFQTIIKALVELALIPVKVTLIAYVQTSLVVGGLHVHIELLERGIDPIVTLALILFMLAFQIALLAVMTMDMLTPHALAATFNRIQSKYTLKVRARDHEAGD